LTVTQYHIYEIYIHNVFVVKLPRSKATVSPNTALTGSNYVWNNKEPYPPEL